MPISTAHDKPLFTPGPLTTSRTVKQAMQRDVGSRDVEFIGIVKAIRDALLDAAGLSQAKGYEAVLMQGSGTFTVESIISATIAPEGELLVVVNGAYGDRIVKIAQTHGIPCHTVRAGENELPSPEEVDAALAANPKISMVAVVHCETTSGIINPIEAIGEVVSRHGRRYFVDSMSAFGATIFDFEAAKIDYLVSSANKCIEGVPGFGFAICRREALQETEGWSRTLSLDLYAQWKGLESNGQFRFTPPTHSILAFGQALQELAEEGGVTGRAKRYGDNHQTILQGMQAMGFREFVDPDLQGHIITSFHYPEDSNFAFDRFYEELNNRGFVIYPGKVTNADCFRIGNIGRLFESDMQALLAAVRDALAAMGVNMPEAAASC